MLLAIRAGCVDLGMIAKPWCRAHASATPADADAMGPTLFSSSAAMRRMVGSSSSTGSVACWYLAGRAAEPREEYAVIAICNGSGRRVAEQGLVA